MLIFLWVLLSFGVGYGALLQGRNAFWWCMLSVILSPLVGGVALMLVNKHGWFGTG